MRYRPEIDGLRAVAVAVVVLFHAGVPGLAGGFVGVDVFLVLSGYLIAGQLANRPQVGTFLMRRARRLVPMLVLVSAASLPFAWALLLPQALKDFGQSAVAGPLFLANLLFWWEAGYFGAVAAEKPLLHLWSLGLEGQFYVLMPLLFWIARGRPATLVATAGVGSFAAGLWASWAMPEAAFYLLPFRFWEFAAGALVALGGWRSRTVWPGALGLGLIFASVLIFDGTMAFPGWAALLPVAGSVLVLVSAPLRPLAWPPMVGLGALSYGVYLWHHPVFVFGGMMAPGVPALALVPLVLALAWASWRWVEVPCRRGVPWPSLGGAVAAVVAAGLGLHVVQGAVWRLPSHARGVLATAERGAMPCHNVLPLEAVQAGALCRVGDHSVEPHMALVGDSHAGHLTAALDEALRARGQAAWVISRGWCLPVPGLEAAAPGRGVDCGSFMAAAWRRLEAQEAVEVVVMAGQWANATQGARSGLLAVPYRFEGRVAPDASANPRIVATALDSLAAQPKPWRIVVLGPVPEFARSVPDTLALAAWRGEAPPDALDFATRNAEALPLLRDFTTNSSAELVSARAVICPPEHPCQGRDAVGRLQYRDASHLARAGAMPLVAKLLQVVDDGAPEQGVRHADLPQRHAAQSQGPR